MALDTSKVVLIDYTNYRGERSKIRVRPERIYFGSTEFHPEPQWIMQALNVDRHMTRHYAVKDIHSWEVPK